MRFWGWGEASAPLRPTLGVQGQNGEAWGLIWGSRGGAQSPTLLEESPTQALSRAQHDGAHPISLVTAPAAPSPFTVSLSKAVLSILVGTMEWDLPGRGGGDPASIAPS